MAKAATVKTRDVRPAATPMKAKPDCCEEAALGMGDAYFPCNIPATKIIQPKNKNEPALRMCDACADHSVKNRGMKLMGDYKPNSVRIIGGANPAPAENPREVIGGNMPPADQVIGEVQRRLADEYAALETTTAATLAKARELPAEIGTEADRAVFGDLIRELRDTSKRAESHREAEKNPYLRAGQAVDGFFNGMKDRLGKAIDVLQNRLNVYQRKLAEAERVKREEIAAEAQRVATAARLAAEDEARRLAELQRQQEEQERKAAESKRLKVQEKAEVIARDVRGQEGRTDALIAQAHQLQVAADHAADRTQASTADLVRHRTGGGAVITSRTVKVVKVDSYNELPLDILRPYLKKTDLEAAVKAWAKYTGYKEAMPGVRIYDEDAAMVR